MTCAKMESMAQEIEYTAQALKEKLMASEDALAEALTALGVVLRELASVKGDNA